FALILSGLVLAIAPTNAVSTDASTRGAPRVLASAAPDAAGRGAGLAASTPWRDRDAFVPVRRDNRTGSGRGPLFPLALVAAIVAAGFARRLPRAEHPASRHATSPLRSRAPPAPAALLLP
ncbi:MAG TPA: hypothetical protein VFA83_11540, partial [Acidimicrobiales bacterium]|nr:hypothetical protein [Acidimicrobiales bacterium]